jgi:ubiquinone/menaquinone biosynthesis C-methylase UbiE
MSDLTPHWDLRATYQGPEFHHWANAEGLNPAERFLIENYLTPNRSTLEAGVGGGRILRGLAGLGFEDRHGFDNAPALIEHARQKDPLNEMAYLVQDARNLSYPDDCFDQVIYLQQIISLIGEEEGRRNAVSEAKRVLKPGGTALFSFLCYDLSQRSLPHRAITAFLSCSRTLMFRATTPQFVPWLRVGEKFNYRALLDRPPYGYWFRIDEAVSLLIAQDFKITAIGTKPQTEAKLCSSLEGLKREPLGGLMLYVVCRK